MSTKPCQKDTRKKILGYRVGFKSELMIMSAFWQIAALVMVAATVHESRSRYYKSLEEVIDELKGGRTRKQFLKNLANIDKRGKAERYW
jgi:hypothetical protein